MRAKARNGVLENVLKQALFNMRNVQQLLGGIHKQGEKEIAIDAGGAVTEKQQTRDEL